MDYLDILKRVLTDTISDEVRDNFFTNTLTPEHIDVALTKKIDGQAIDGKVVPSKAETMIGIPRLNNIQYCIEQVINNKVEGDLIETGVWRGGATIFMAAALKYFNEDRIVYVADSFEGLPLPDKKYPADDNDPHHAIEYLKVSLQEVKANFKKYGFLNNNIIFIKGFFADSLKKNKFKKLSIVRLDGDMYSSTFEALTLLYNKLSIGGYLIVDDYYLPACKKAVDDFREQNNINEEIITIDWTGVYWEKLK